MIAVDGTELHERLRFVARSAGCHPCSLPEASAPRCQRNRFSVITSNHHELPEPRLAHEMGNGLSVSSVVDLLHALQPVERSGALDKLYEQVSYSGCIPGDLLTLL